MGAGKKLFGYHPEGDVWLPLQVDEDGKPYANVAAGDLGDIGDVDLTGIADGDILYWDDATSTWKVKAISATKLIDADGDTKVDVEESADEDMVRMDVKGVEAFVIHDDGILDLPKQSAVRAGSLYIQIIPSGNWTLIEFNNTTFDIQSEFDVINYKFVATRAGIYFLTAFIYFAAGEVVADKAWGVRLFRGAAALKTAWLHSSHAAPIAISVSDIFQLAAGNEITAKVYQNTGVDKNLSGGLAGTTIGIVKLT